MAENEKTEWGRRMQACLDANEGTGRPTTWYGLATTLAADPRSNQIASSWKSTITRIRKDERLKETTAVMIAEALGVPRSELPPSSDRLTLQLLDGRLQRVEADKANADDVQASLRVFASAIESLAKGDTDAALRTLSEAARR